MKIHNIIVVGLLSTLLILLSAKFKEGDITKDDALTPLIIGGLLGIITPNSNQDF